MNIIVATYALANLYANPTEPLFHDLVAGGYKTGVNHEIQMAVSDSGKGVDFDR